jgi:hypothetical protein
VGGTTYLHGYTSCFAIFRPLYAMTPAADLQAAVSIHPASPPPHF